MRYLNERKKRGRPRERRPKRKVFKTIRLTLVEWRMVQKKMEEAGLNFSDYAREMILEKERRVEYKEPEPLPMDDLEELKRERWSRLGQ